VVMLAGRLRHRWQRCRLVPTAKRVPAVHCARKLPAPTELATHGYFGDAIRFSVSGNFRPDFGIGFMRQRHEIRCSQFADAAARGFCLTIANYPGGRTPEIRCRASDGCCNYRPSRQNGTY
jgi:hypothetical protein